MRNSVLLAPYLLAFRVLEKWNFIVKKVDRISFSVLQYRANRWAIAGRQ